jgi:hypothetical protein
MRFRIFKKNKANFELTPNVIALGGLVFVCLSLIYMKVFGEDLNLFEEIVFLVGILLLFFFYIGRQATRFQRVPMNGRFTGYIEFKPSSIVVYQNEYKLEAISEFFFNVHDYGGRTINLHGLNNLYSNGVDNEIVFKLNNGERLAVHFQIKSKNDMICCKKELQQYSAKLTFNEAEV